MEQLEWPRFALEWWSEVGLVSLSKWRSWFGGTHEEMEK